MLAINRGKQHGMVAGNALAVFSAPEVVSDRGTSNTWRNAASVYEKVELPKERAGTVLLFAVHDRMSYGLVVESTTAVRNGDYIKHPAFGHRDTGLSNFMQ